MSRYGSGVLRIRQEFDFWLRLAFSECLELPHKGIAFFFLVWGIGAFIRSRGYKELDLVVALQEQGADVRRQANHTITHAVQQGFNMME
ncbi:MAG: hypothetical protein IPG42_18650 [Betaproteobacteria bacterium]|nr:hypothetical protein [Betaproteobacteria bacterium]